jgi:hypothetical protein
MIAAVDRGRFALIGRGENRRSMVYVKNVVEARWPWPGGGTSRAMSTS